MYPLISASTLSCTSLVELWPEGQGGGGGGSETARCSRACSSVVLPLLAVDDAGVAAELTAAAAAGFGQEPAAAGQLDELLYDMGSWAAAVAEAEARAAATGAAPRLGRLHSGLGAHLLCHVRAVGWTATAEWVARQIRRCGGGSGGSEGTAGAATAGAAAVLDSPSAAGAAAAASNAHDIGAVSDGICGSEDSPGALSSSTAAAPAALAPAVPVAAGGLTAHKECTADVECTADATAAIGARLMEEVEDVGCSKRRKHVEVAAEAGDGDGDGGCGAAAAGCRRGPSAASARGRGSVGLRAALASLRLLVSEPSPSEAAALRAMTEQWVAKLAETLQVIELLLLLALVLRGVRAGQPLLCPENLIALTSLGVGSALMVAWLVLPYRTWARLAVRARLPRYGGLLLAKALVAAAVAPAPSGVGQYVAGLGILLHEGLIVPGANLLSPRTAVLVAAAMLLVNAGVALACGVARGAVAAALLAARGGRGGGDDARLPRVPAATEATEAAVIAVGGCGCGGGGAVVDLLGVNAVWSRAAGGCTGGTYGLGGTGTGGAGGVVMRLDSQRRGGGGEGGGGGGGGGGGMEGSDGGGRPKGCKEE
ncbi:hypothetical protein PLESTF_000566400 [Pleodorina starrii]|nr:hypothetical protein PLESTF_000566400 [Pleodorina starrii]